jgi:hypothetical protein
MITCHATTGEEPTLETSHISAMSHTLKALSAQQILAENTTISYLYISRKILATSLCEVLDLFLEQLVALLK